MSDPATLEGYLLGWRSSSPIYRLHILGMLTDLDENEFYKLMKIKSPSDFRKALLKHGN